MSVLIKGLKMPKDCMDCPFKGFDRNGGRGNVCTIDKSISLHACLDGLDVKFIIMGDCPLIELPDHGDLVDRDIVWRDMVQTESFQEAQIAIWKAPVVIQAERSEDE